MQQSNWIVMLTVRLGFPGSVANLTKIPFELRTHLHRFGCPGWVKRIQEPKNADFVSVIGRTCSDGVSLHVRCEAKQRWRRWIKELEQETGLAGGAAAEAWISQGGVVVSFRLLASSESVILRTTASMKLGQLTPEN
jgi:hypothetical protein